METNHKKEVLSQMVNDQKFLLMPDAISALDMSRTGATNGLLREAVVVLRELGWTVEK